MNVWKFWLPRGRWTMIETGEDGGDLEAQGCLAIVLASTEDEARKMLTRYGAETGIDMRWTKAAHVASFPLDQPVVLGYAEV